MKILLVITGLGMGGAEKLVTSLADQFISKGHDVVVAYMTGEVILSPKSNCVNLINLNVNSIKNAFGAYFKLRRLIIDFKPDVVHSHLLHANILCRSLRLTTAIPRLISSAHNTDEEGWMRFLAYRLTDRLADISTNVSDEAVEAFIKKKAVRPGRMLTLHNGISITEFVYSEQSRNDVRRQLGMIKGEQLILAVGRLNEQKDYPNLLSAILVLSKNYPNIKLAIAGNGPLLQDLKKIVDKLGIRHIVNFLGVREDIPSLMSAADVFVLSSAWEGFGLVVAEAMACKQVVVATDCGGVKEVVGDAGFLVPPKNFVALATALQQALTLEHDDRIQLGEKARQRSMQLYSLDMATEKWLRLYSVPINKLLTSLTNEAKV